MALPALTPEDVAGRHLLLLPADVGHDEVEILALSRFPHARWEVEPTTVPPRPSGGARGLRYAEPPPGRLRLSRHSVLVGPYLVDADAAASLAVPTTAALAYELEGPVERGERPWPGAGDRDGLSRVFAGGLPVRDEERCVAWLVAAARRLGGAVRAAAHRDSPGGLLVPDPASAVDLTVWTDVWLDPEVALQTMRRAVPRARLNLPPISWDGPPAGTGAQPAPGVEGMGAEARRSLHATADDHDIATLTEPPAQTGYGCLADLDLDGLLALEVGPETDLPPAIAVVPWAAHGAVAYRVRWEPPDLAELHAERPAITHRVARGRAAPLVVAVARSFHRAVGGEVTDEMDFVVDPADL